MTGLSLAYYAYTRDMPLTIRSALTPLFGGLMNGFLGHVVDVLGVVATILGVSVTIGFGVSQFIDGIYAITGMEWIMDMGGEVPTPSKVGLIAALVAIMGLSIISAVSGVGRGVKYLSNLNLVLSLILLFTFIFFGSFAFAMTTYGSAMVDYIIHFVSLSFGAYGPQSAGRLCRGPARGGQADGRRAVRRRHQCLERLGRFRRVRGVQVGPRRPAAELDEATLVAVYEAGNPVASSAGKRAGPPSTGPGGSRSRPSWACSWPASPRAGACASLSSAA